MKKSYFKGLKGIFNALAIAVTGIYTILTTVTILMTSFSLLTGTFISDSLAGRLVRWFVLKSVGHPLTTLIGITIAIIGVVKIIRLIEGRSSEKSITYIENFRSPLVTP